MRPWVALVVVAAAAGPAQAGRSHYGWLYGSEVNPERAVELETWILERNGRGDEETEETSTWWAPVVGITDHVEVAIPVEIEWNDHGGIGVATTQLVRWGAEVRWRPQSVDPVEAGPLTTLFRAGVKRVVAKRFGVRGEADAVVAYETGRVHIEGDLGIVATRAEGDTVAEIRPAAGVSVRVVADLRVGAETYGELELSGRVDDWMVAGPSLAWTHGRFWLAGTFGIGLFGVTTAPRVNFAVAF